MGADICRHFSANAALGRQIFFSTQHPTARPHQCARTSKDSLTSKMCQNLTIDTLIDVFEFAYTYIMGADIFRRRRRNIRRIRTETKTCTPTPQDLSAYQISFGSAAWFSRSRCHVHPSVRPHTTNTIVSFACKAKLTKKHPNDTNQGSLYNKKIGQKPFPVNFC